MKGYIKKQKKIFILAILLGAITSVGSAVLSAYLGTVIDTAIEGDFVRFKFQTIFTIGAYLFVGIVYYLYVLCTKRFAANISSSMRKNLFQGIFRKSKRDFCSMSSAEYLSIMSNDVKIVEENYLALLLSVIENIIAFLACLFVMLYLSPLVTLSLIAAMALLILVPAFFQKSLQKRQDGYSNKLSEFTEKAKDYLMGYEVIRSYNIFDRTEQKFSKINADLRNSKNKLDKITGLVESVSMILGVLVQCSVLFVSSYLIIQGKLSAGVMVALVSVSGGISVPIQVISANLSKMQGVKSVLEKIQKTSEVNTDMNQESITKLQNPIFENSIDMNQVSFSYDGEKEALKDINLKIHKRKKYAVVGKSGCGKSTLIDVMTGGYDNYQGTVLYDGKALKTLDNNKVACLSSVIHQNVYMFNESISNNIDLHEQFPEELWEEALEGSGTNLFARTKEQLMQDTGENGSKLSGGQKQRIAVARALIRRKPLLILDEGTSAIDKNTAYEVESRLLERPELTMLTVTHNMDAGLLSKYDEIIYMEDGTIKEQGSFEKLIHSSGEFCNFYHRAGDSNENIA